MTDGSRIVLMWGEPHSVTQTITRQLTHHAYHAEQIVLPAEQHPAGTWRPLGIPREQSEAFNAVMRKQRGEAPG